MSTETVGLSGIQNVDGLLGGVRWSGSTVGFAFPTLASQYTGYPYLSDTDGNPFTPPASINEPAGLVPLSALQQTVVRTVFRSLTALTGVTGVESNPIADADIKIAMSTARYPGNTTAYAFYPGDEVGGDVWLNTTSYNSPHIGTYGYQTFFHEIGHALGLKHSFQGDPGNPTVVTADRDSLEFTVMSYHSYVDSPISGYTVSDGSYPQGFMMLDIAALQYLYGADYTSAAGNDLYVFDAATAQLTISGVAQGLPKLSNGTTNSNVLSRTVWDGGGNDTYDFSGYGADRQLAIDLAPGGWTDVDSDSSYQAARLGSPGGVARYAVGQVFNALLVDGDVRGLIENAIGGAGDDVILGNQAGNRLQGRNGNDRLEGLDGDDTLEGGEGNDTLRPGTGNDSVDGGNGVDLVSYFGLGTAVTVDLALTVAQNTVGAGIDTLLNVENAAGGNGNDTLRGTAGANVLFGNDGNDLIEARGGDDTLNGQGGNDNLRPSTGNDIVDGGPGTDLVGYLDITAAVTVDLSVTVAQNTVGAGFDTITNVEGVAGGSGNDTLRGDANANVFYGNNGNDLIEGRGGNDTLNGQEGNDNLRPGTGDDLVDGGNGVDMVGYVDAPAAVTVDLAVTGVQNTGGAGLDRIVNVENLAGGAFDDVLRGTSGANTFYGNAGADTIDGRGGADVLNGQDGNDRLIGGGGNDVLTGGAGIDTFVYTTTADALPGGVVESITDFVSGVDHIDFTALDWSVAAGFQSLSFVFGGFSAAGQVRFAAGQLLFNFDANAASAEMVVGLPGVVALTLADVAPPPAPLPAAAPAGLSTAGMSTDEPLQMADAATPLTVLGGYLI